LLPFSEMTIPFAGKFDVNLLFVATVFILSVIDSALNTYRILGWGAAVHCNNRDRSFTNLPTEAHTAQENIRYSDSRT